MADEMMGATSVDALVEALSGARRRARQDAAHQLALMAREDVAAMAPYVNELIDALYRPEAQTRWEVFDVLGQLALVDPGSVEGGYDGAEAALFDESSATVRLAAFRYLCRVGASSPERSDQVWHLLDEAVQCYHGDPEYHDMLIALLEFARGSLSEQAAAALVARVSFDAENGTSYTRGYSTQIIAAVKGQE